MLCVTCHDPHVAVAAEDRVAHYRSRCQRCHEDKGCALPRPVRLERQADDSCIACHMPSFATADIAHTAATDHRILRWPSLAAAGEQPHSDEGENQSLEPFHSFPRQDEAEVQRDLGLALLKMMQDNEASPELFSSRAEALLGSAVQRDTEDVPAWEALGLTLLMRHRRTEGLAVLEDVLHRNPDRETALTAAATLSWNLGRKEQSLSYWKRAVAMNPWLPSYRRALTQALLQLRQWDEARSSCRTWLSLEPRSREARQALIDVLLREGKTNEAREEFARLEALNPPDLAALRDWFNQRTR
jgi:tetratricopeptide (TPR) repeat protein